MEPVYIIRYQKQINSPKCLSADKTCAKTVQMKSSDQSMKLRLTADLEIIYKYTSIGGADSFRESTNIVDIPDINRFIRQPQQHQ